MANKLREIRKSKGMTQEELAEKSGVSRSTIIAIENTTDSITVKSSTLTKLAQALNETISNIFFV